MKGIILVNPYTKSESELNQPQRLYNELRARGVCVELRRNLFFGERGELPDFCVYFDKDKYCARRLEAAGVRLFNRANAIELCDDKMLTALALNGFPMPKTFAAPLCYYPEEPIDEDFYETLESEFGYPIVVKECFGSLGKGVYKADNRAELKTLCEKLKSKPHLFQQFVSESAGTDVRVIVIGGKTVCAMKRTSNEFRSNISVGGKGEPCKLEACGIKLCEEVAEKLGLDYCGIDLLLSGSGYLICEVNSNAFFGTAERVTGVNIAGLYADHICAEMCKK